MTARCEAIVLTLLGVARKHGKKYCWPSQVKIQELVGKYEKLGFSITTLNRDLRWLEDNGYISRLRRIRVGQGGKLVYNSTLYKFTGKLFNHLYFIGNKVKKVFSFFRLPFWVNHRSYREQVSSPKPAAPTHLVLIQDKDGSVKAWDPRKGEFLER